MLSFSQIQCKTNGRPSPQVTWTVGGSPVMSTNEDIVVQKDGSLLVMGLVSTACARYNCTASNPLNISTSFVTICGESI